MPDAKRVRFEGVTKRFGPNTILHDVNLDVDAGECVVLLGPSGCGKTTLLRLLAGLESADAGRIFVGDRLVNDVPPAERDVAMVFQNYALYPHMSVAQNIGFPLVARGVDRAEIDRRVRDVASRLDLAACLSRRPSQLSGGQQQRVALARAIVRSPAVYLMDEPLSNLDAQLRVQTRAELKRLQQELRTTTIHVTHDQAEAMTLGHRVAILRAGRVEQFGAPLELYRTPANRFVAQFLGSPGINVWRGEVADSRARAAGMTIPLPSGLPADRKRPLDVAVRPEDVQLRAGVQPGWTEARVDVVEAVGNETIVFLASGGDRVVARTGPDFPAGPGQPAWFRVDPARILWFDGTSGARIKTL